MLDDQLKAILSDRLWATAELLIAHFKGKGYRVSQLASIDDTYTYKLHLVCKKKYETIGIEIRERCVVEKYFENSINGWYSQRTAAKIFFAVPVFISEKETQVGLSQMLELKRLGTGLFLIKNTEIIKSHGTVGCHRKFALEPGTSLGKYKSKIEELIREYNLDDCLSSVKMLTEVVEEAIVLLAKKAIRKTKINLTIQQVENNEVDLSQIIDCLGAKVYAGNPQTQIITKPLRLELQSYRDTRNLSNHWRTAAQLSDLEKKYPEAMQTGIRLLRKLVSLIAQV